MFGLLPVIFRKFVTKVIALDLRQFFVSAQYLENKLTLSNQILYMHLSFFAYLLKVDRDSANCIYAFILILGSDYYTSCFYICTTVMALDFHQNFVSAQYLETN